MAFIPVAILLLGLDTSMRRWVVAYAALWPILINTIYGVRGSDQLLHDVARTSGVTRLGRLVRVSVPAALPSIATGLRVSASIALLALPAGSAAPLTLSECACDNRGTAAVARYRLPIKMPPARARTIPPIRYHIV